MFVLISVLWVDVLGVTFIGLVDTLRCPNIQKLDSSVNSLVRSIKISSDACSSFGVIPAPGAYPRTPLNPPKK